MERRTKALDCLVALGRGAGAEAFAPAGEQWWHVASSEVGQHNAHLYAFRPRDEEVPRRYAILVGPDIRSIRVRRRSPWVDAPDRSEESLLRGRVRAFLPDVRTVAIAQSLRPRLAAEASAMRPDTWRLALDLVAGPPWWLEHQLRQKQQTRGSDQHWEERDRKARSRQRLWRESDGAVLSQVPLTKNEGELRALIALRCVQQGYCRDGAWLELEAYARRLRVAWDRDSNLAATIRFEAVEGVIRWGVDYAPGGLATHVRCLARFVQSERWTRGAGEREEIVEQEWERRNEERKRGRIPASAKIPEARDPLTVGEFATLAGCPRRTVYSWIERGLLKPADKNPFRLSRKDLDLARNLVKRKPGALYRAVQQRRGCRYDAARMYVHRRKGMEKEEILREAAMGDE